MSEQFHTSPGSQPVHFEVAGVQVTKRSVGSMDNNVYLLAAGSGPLVLIDAADDAARLLAEIDGREVGALITTHRHPDHLRALAEVATATGAPCWAGEPDAAAIASQSGVTSTGVWSGDRISVGAIDLAVIGLRGHTPGSIALVLAGGDGPSHIFTGDSLFPGGVGKTGSPAEFISLLGDVTHEIFDRFPDDTVIHPGHGDATTLGTERPHLEQWRRRGW